MAQPLQEGHAPLTPLPRQQSAGKKTTCVRNANAGKCPHLSPRSPDTAGNSSVGATCTEDFAMQSSACWDSVGDRTASFSTGRCSHIRWKLCCVRYQTNADGKRKVTARHCVTDPSPHLQVGGAGRTRQWCNHPVSATQHPEG